MDTITVAIIGAGPAGIAAALQLQRQEIPFRWFEREAVGGLLRNAHWVENYPGFPQGISGLDLAALFQRHLQTVGIAPTFTEVQHLRLDRQNFALETDSESLLCRIAIIASGTQPKRWDGIPTPPGLQDRIFYEVHPLRDISGQRIAIIGAGDAAFDYALTLAEGNQVQIFSRSAELRCLPFLHKRCVEETTISLHREANVKGVLPENEQMRLSWQQTGDSQLQSELFDYLLIAIGREPKLEFISEELRQRQGELCAAGRLFFIGDVASGKRRQTAIAVGQGIDAAMRCSELLHRRSQ